MGWSASSLREDDECIMFQDNFASVSNDFPDWIGQFGSISRLDNPQLTNPDIDPNDESTWLGVGLIGNSTATTPFSIGAKDFDSVGFYQRGADFVLTRAPKRFLAFDRYWGTQASIVSATCNITVGSLEVITTTVENRVLVPEDGTHPFDTIISTEPDVWWGSRAVEVVTNGTNATIALGGARESGGSLKLFTIAQTAVGSAITSGEQTKIDITDFLRSYLENRNRYAFFQIYLIPDNTGIPLENPATEYYALHGLLQLFVSGYPSTFIWNVFSERWLPQGTLVSTRYNWGATNINNVSVELDGSEMPTLGLQHGSAPTEVPLP